MGRWIRGYWITYWRRRWIPAHWRPGDDYKVVWTTTETKSETYSSHIKAIRKKISTGGSLSSFRKKIGTRVAGYKVFKRVREIRRYVKYVRSYLFNGWNSPEDESEILVTPKNNYRGTCTVKAIGDPNIKVAIQGGFLKVKPISRRRSLHSGKVRVTPINNPFWIGEWHEDRTYTVGLGGSRPSPEYWSRYWTTTESPAPPTPSEPSTPSEDKGTLVIKAVEKGNESNIIEDATIKVTQGGSKVFTVEGSGSKKLDLGSYSVSFESETPSGWKRTDTGLQSCTVKANEITTVKGYYGYYEKISEPSETPESATMHVKAYRLKKEGLFHEHTTYIKTHVKFEWNGEEYRTPKTFTVKPNVEQKVTFHYVWVVVPGVERICKTETITKTFGPCEERGITLYYQTGYAVGVAPVIP